MKVNEVIFDWIYSSIEKFPWITIKYEYSKKRHIHYISILPESNRELTEEYCSDENEFSFKLDQMFPNEVVLFGTENSLFTVSPNALSFTKNLVVKFQIEDTLKEGLFFKTENDNSNNCLEYNYSYAA